VVCTTAGAIMPTGVNVLTLIAGAVTTGTFHAAATFNVQTSVDLLLATAAATVSLGGYGQLTAGSVANILRLSPDTTPTSLSVASWLLRDAYLSVDVSAAQAASDTAKKDAGLQTDAKSGVSVNLVDFCNGASSSVPGVTAGTALYWPLVIQINSRCRDKKQEANKFQLSMESTYIISSTLLNKQSFFDFHSANRKLIGAAVFTVAPEPPGPQVLNPTPQDPTLKYATLGANDYLQGLDNLQLFYPSYTAGYALAYAEYTQTFVLQYYGEFIDGATTCDNNGAAAVAACQLTFTETLKSVFPLTDAKRSENVDSVTATATQFRASVFHPTRTGGSSITAATAVPEALTFRHIFGRGTLLSGETGEFEDLTPLSNTGTSVTTTSVLANAAYTNGKYTITDLHGLKQKVKKIHCSNRTRTTAKQ